MSPSMVGNVILPNKAQISVNNLGIFKIWYIYLFLHPGIPDAMGDVANSKRPLVIIPKVQLHVRVTRRSATALAGYPQKCNCACALLADSVQIKWSSGRPDAQNCSRTTWTSQQVIRGTTRLTSPELEFDFENFFHLFWSASTFKIDGFKH